MSPPPLTPDTPLYWKEEAGVVRWLFWNPSRQAEVQQRISALRAGGWQISNIDGVTGTAVAFKAST